MPLERGETNQSVPGDWRDSSADGKDTEIMRDTLGEVGGIRKVPFLGAPSAGTDRGRFGMGRAGWVHKLGAYELSEPSPWGGDIQRGDRDCTELRFLWHCSK